MIAVYEINFTGEQMITVDLCSVWIVCSVIVKLLCTYNGTRHGRSSSQIKFELHVFSLKRFIVYVLHI